MNFNHFNQEDPFIFPQDNFNNFRKKDNDPVNFFKKGLKIVFWACVFVVGVVLLAWGVKAFLERALPLILK